MIIFGISFYIKRQRYLLSPHLFNRVVVNFLTSETGQEKEIKGIEINKQKIKLPPFVLDIMYCRKSERIHRRKRSSLTVWVAQVVVASSCHQKCCSYIPSRASTGGNQEMIDVSLLHHCLSLFTPTPRHILPFSLKSVKNISWNEDEKNLRNNM